MAMRQCAVMLILLMGSMWAISPAAADDLVIGDDLSRFYIGSMTRIVVNGDALSTLDSLPEKLNLVEIFVNLDHTDFRRFQLIKMDTLVRVRSIAYSPALDMKFIDKPDAENVSIRLQAVLPAEDSAVDYHVRMQDIATCLQLWAEGEWCLIEIVEQLAPQHGSGATGG